jgi:hypothetical protein
VLTQTLRSDRGRINGRFRPDRAGGLLGSELSGALAEHGHAVVAMLHRSTAIHRNDVYLENWTAGPHSPDVDRPTGRGLGWKVSKCDFRRSVEARHEVPSV